MSAVYLLKCNKKGSVTLASFIFEHKLLQTFNSYIFTHSLHFECRRFIHFMLFIIHIKM